MYADVATHSRKMLEIEGRQLKCDAKSCNLVRDLLQKSAAASQCEFSNVNQQMKFKAASLYAVPWAFNQQQYSYLSHSFHSLPSFTKLILVPGCKYIPKKAAYKLPV